MYDVDIKDFFKYETEFKQKYHEFKNAKKVD